MTGAFPRNIPQISAPPKVKHFVNGRMNKPFACEPEVLKDFPVLICASAALLL
jgi:hypothetical protein